MSFVDTLRHWDKAVACADGKEISEALSIFLSIQEPNSKIHYNIGCLQLINQDFDAAEKAFDRSIGKDEHLAVAFFQRGITFYKKERFEECLDDFQYALKELRGNQLIDYKALGLTYHLYACEVLHNMALARAQMGRWDKAQEHLVSALNYKTEVKLNLLDRALEATLKRKLFKLAEVPAKLLFKPNQKYVAELEKKDYLGKAKVVASVSPRDAGFSGFAPLQPQVEDIPVDPKPPETLRAFEGEPHTVLYEFVPQNSEELAVVPGNLVFMHAKGQDNWASVLFNGRKGLVPYNFLQPITLSSKQYQDLKKNGSGAAPPQRREAPVSPAEKSPVALERKGSPATATRHREHAPTRYSLACYTPDVKREQDAVEESSEPGESPLCTVKVFYTYTIAVSVSAGSPYAALVQKISRKLNVPADSITLSLSSTDNGQTVMDPNTDMEKVWSRASGGRITLRCEKKDQDQDQDLKEEVHTDEQPAKQTQLVALHSYESSNPEDLQFNKGDTITLLSKVNEQWYEGRCHGNIGIFPASFVEEAPVGGQ